MIATLLGLCTVPLAATAQEAETPPRPFVYATYFECAPTQEWLADMIVDSVFKPVYDAAVKDGTISAWGWIAHNTGGKWRRDIYRVAPTFEQLWDGGEVLRKRVAEVNADAAREIGVICSAHDDYIWQWVNGSGPTNNADVAMVPSKAGVSQYLVCDMAKQERADELIAGAAAIYNRHVKEGELTGWGWLEHVVGGEYRRLLTLRGADHAGVLKAWGAINEEIDKEQKEASKEFNEICYTHQDYIWNIVH